MSKKDYQAIARAIYDTRREHGEGSSFSPRAKVTALDTLAGRLANYLAADSPHFDRARFIEACETGKCKGMREKTS